MIRSISAISAFLIVCLVFPVFAEKPRMAVECRAVDTLETLLAPGAVIFFGELHGTQEAPAFVTNATCLALHAGHRVRIGLEVWHEEGERIDAFLASQGAAEDRAALLEGAFWNRNFQDGRSSQAMVALLDELRRFRRGGHSVSLSLFDSSKSYGSGQERDRAMATRLGEEINANRNEVVLVLAGNIHSRIAKGTPWDAEFEPMGLLLAGLLSDRSSLLTFDASWSGGDAWICRGSKPEDCRAQEVRPREEGEDWSMQVSDASGPGKNGHNGSYHVGKLHASMPAVGGGLPGRQN